jgi:hypothetical protein
MGVLSIANLDLRPQVLPGDDGRLLYYFGRQLDDALHRSDIGYAQRETRRALLRSCQTTTGVLSAVTVKQRRTSGGGQEKVCLASRTRRW